MDVVNHSPFPHLVFESRSPDDLPFAIVVVRGTFALRDGEPLRPVPRQEPVRLGDSYRGSPASTSLRFENDIAPFKPRSDIVLDAIARAPGGRPLSEWTVRVRVGRISSDLVVSGPYLWQHSRFDGWKATTPVPSFEVPITYELAWGGAHDERNPVGIGAIDSSTPRDAEIAGARIAAPGTQRALDARQTPRGLGPLAPSWTPRRALAGTFDDTWRNERWPCVPADFDFGFYNAAHPDLVYPGHLRGDEPIELYHLSSAPMRTSLPSYRVFGLGWGRGKIAPFDLALDTVALDLSASDPEEHRAYLTWRAAVPLSHDFGLIEMRMTHPQRSEVRHGR
jgi:hypothetical protein